MIWAIFGPQNFGVETPPPSSLLIHPLLPPSLPSPAHPPPPGPSHGPAARPVGYDFALTDLNKKESQIHVNNWMSFNVRGKTARLLQNLRILHLKYMHDVLVDNDCAHFPPDVIECFAKLIESQAQQERELAEEDDYAAPSGKGFGKGKGKGKGKGGGKGVGGGGWSVDDPFLQAQIARMQAQSGGWFAYGGAYGSSYPAPAPQVVARGPAPAVAPAGGAAAGGSQKFGPQRMPC